MRAANSTNGWNAGCSSSALGTSTATVPPSPTTRAISSQRAMPVGEEHQRHLAQRHVEGAVGERQRGGVALPPVDVRAHASGDGEHRLVEIDADDRSVGADEVGGGAGDDPRPARDVEDRLPR